MGKKKKEHKLAKAEKLELAGEIHRMMLEGTSEAEIMDELEISTEVFNIARKFLLAGIGDRQMSMSREERYAEYLIAQQTNVRDLGELIENLNNKSQFNALVGALRLRSDIAERVITTGQLLGVVEKDPDRKEVVIAGVALSDMEDKDLKKGVVKAFAGLKNLMSKYGDGQNIMELPEPKQLHYGATAVEAVVTSVKDVDEPKKKKKKKSKDGTKDKKRKKKRKEE